MAGALHEPPRVGSLGGVLPCPHEHGAALYGPEHHGAPGQLQAAQTQEGVRDSVHRAV